jgi:signal transduction histidine kinase
MNQTQFTPPLTRQSAVLQRLQHGLIAPAASVPRLYHQRIQLLAILNLVMLVFSTIGAGIAIAFARANNEFLVTEFGSVVGLVILLVGYLSTRTPYYELSAYITTFIPVVGVGLPTLTAYAPEYIAVLIVTPVVSSILLSSRMTFVAGMLVMLVSLVSYMVSGSGQSTLQFIILFVLLLIVALVMTVASILREQQIASLEIAREQLREQVEIAEKARQQAERSDHVKSAFLASMSHELRTPLNAIINFTRYVVKGTLGPLNPEQTDALTDVVESAKHLLNLINDVLDMSKIEAGALRLFVEDNINIHAILESIITTGRSLVADKPIQIHADYPATLPLLRGDRQRITQILLNLMSNAVKFTAQGSVTLTAYAQNALLILAISDTGMGIAPEDQKAVFEAFKQTDAGLRQGGGTGLGMPITKSLVEAHGGSIRLESELGKGTTFFITLPIKADHLLPSIVS